MHFTHAIATIATATYVVWLLWALVAATWRAGLAGKQLSGEEAARVAFRPILVLFDMCVVYPVNVFIDRRTKR